jgi:hypothetical protein
MDPVMTRRDADLGWIAGTPADYPLRFAVVGKDEAEAIERFREAVARWEAIPVGPEA